MASRAMPVPGKGTSDATFRPDAKIVRTRNGAQFDASADVWSFRDAAVFVKLDFAELKASCDLVKTCKRLLTWYAEHRSADHLRNSFCRLRHFFDVSYSQSGRGELTSEVTLESLANYRSALNEREQWYLSNLAGVILRWDDFGYPGVSPKAIKWLRETNKKGNVVGEAVAVMDPINGPYSDIEFEEIQSRLRIAYGYGKVSLAEYMLVTLFMSLGARPVQIAALKIMDLTAVSMSAEREEKIYFLNVPRAKQRNVCARKLFKKRMLIPEIGAPLARYASEVESMMLGRIKNVEMSPLFPAEISEGNEPKGFEYHKIASDLAQDLTAIVEGLGIFSHRTGQPLHVTATRFRRTIGTRAAMEGNGERVIAELLDHSNTNNVGVYVQSRPEIVERIDRALAMQLAPLAQAFAGKIINTEAEAKRAGDPSSHIISPKISESVVPMGSCGSFGFCQLMAPISCYTCISFQPWADGPHEEVLSFLIEERERIKKLADSRLAAVNDRTILAVAQVIQLCSKIKKEEM